MRNDYGHHDERQGRGADPSDYTYFLAEWQRLQEEGVIRIGAGDGDSEVYADSSYTERLGPGTVRCFAGELLMAGYMIKFSD